MNPDSMADEALASVIDHWRDEGPLDEILAIIDEVWRTNLGRHEPRLGDDATSLGIQCSRNVMNRVEQSSIVGEVEGCRVRGGSTLEVSFDRQVLHASKVGGNVQRWNPYSMDWGSSDVRAEGAAANSRAYISVAGTLFEDHGGLDRGPLSDPFAMRHLHLAWQGLAEGLTRVYLGFPSAGALPWMAVRLLKDGRSGGGGRLAEALDRTPSTPNHDAMAEPVLEVKRRREDAQGSA